MVISELKLVKTSFKYKIVHRTKLWYSKIVSNEMILSKKPK